jgi:hypothetical protein
MICEEVRPDNDLARRLRERADLVKNAYLILPILKGDHEEWEQYGRGQVTNPEWCGKPTSFYICRDTDTHSRAGKYQGLDYSGKNAVSQGHIWCKKKECPKCFLDGIVGDSARAIWGKLGAGIEHGLGPVEHFVTSFSKEGLVLPEGMSWFEYEKVLRKKVIDGLSRRGVTGAVLIPHARRIANRGKVGFRYLKFSLHYHSLGFIAGGYEICRNCPYIVYGSNREWCSNSEICKGWEQRTRRAYEEDGLIVRVMAKRASGLTEEESVMKTARYILSHASYIRNFRKRFYVLSYFGRLANRNLKAVKIRAVHLCPVCASVGVKNESKRCVHQSKEYIPRDVGNPLYVKCFPSTEFDESGLPRFVDFGGRGGLDG